MSCCSSRRSAQVTAQQMRPAVVPPPPPAAAGQTLHYTGTAALALRGPLSGRIYRVGPDYRQITADSRDLGALLRTGQFRK